MHEVIATPHPHYPTAATKVMFTGSKAECHAWMKQAGETITFTLSIQPAKVSA